MFPLAAVLVMAAEPAVPIPDEVVRDRAAFLPVRRYEPLPGKVVGVLAGDTGPVVALDSRGGPPDALAFSRDGKSYRWVYVPAAGASPTIRDLSLPVGEKGDRRVVFPALDMANPKTVKAAGVKAPFALVEVEVNNGDGAPASESFVATKITPLDGSKAYPLKVADAVEKMRERYRGYLAERQNAIASGMEASRKAALGSRSPTGPRETAEVLYVTWLPEKERVRVAFRTTITDGAYQTRAGTVEGADASPAKKVPPARWGTSFGVEFGRAYEVSKYGDLVKTQTLPVEAFSREVAQPPAPARPVLPAPPKKP